MEKLYLKRAGAVIVSVCLLTGILAGCSGTTDGEAASSSAVQDGTYTLQVDSIDGSTVSGTIGEFSGNTSWMDGSGSEMDGEMPSDMPERPSDAPDGMPSGDMPEMPSGDPGEMPSGDMPQMPSDAPDEMPSFAPDEMPSGFSGRGGGMGGFTASEETIKFAISEDAIITVQSFQGSQEGTLDDIAAGSILEVTISSGTATEVTVISLMQGGGGFGGGDTDTDGTSNNTTEDSDISGES